MSRPLRIAVVGERNASADLLAAAEVIGREIARRGGVVVCGGMEGAMEATSRGATAAQDVVVGVLPGPTAGDGNACVTIPIVTGMGEGRNIIIARTAEAMIAVGGAYGTLSEIAYALDLGVPVIGYQTWVLQRAGGLRPEQKRRGWYEHEVSIDLGPGRVSNVVVRDVQLTGPTGATDTAVDGIAVENGNQIQIERATITGPMGDGIDLKADNVTVRQVDARNYDRNGMKFWGASGTLVYFSRGRARPRGSGADIGPYESG